MTKAGRPLRFLALVLGGWTALRVVMLWPGSDMPVATLIDRGGPVARERMPAPEPTPPPVRTAVAHRVVQPGTPVWAPASAGAGTGPARADTPVVAMKVAPREKPSPDPPVVRPLPLPLPVSPADPGAIRLAAAPLRPLRLNVDTWLVARPGGRDSLSFGQLGGSQAGVRVSYPLEASRRLAASARLSAPLAGRGAEAGVGLDWRSPIAPIHLLAEARVPLDGARAGSAVELIAGEAWRLPRGLTLAGYAQGGAVQRRGGFIDAAATISHALHRHLALGAGAWGAAQRGVSRLDVGPELSLSVPSGGGFVRLALDYRARVAGRARPASGPALSLGGSF